MKKSEKYFTVGKSEKYLYLETISIGSEPYVVGISESSGEPKHFSIKSVTFVNEDSTTGRQIL